MDNYNHYMPIQLETYVHPFVSAVAKSSEPKLEVKLLKSPSLIHWNVFAQEAEIKSYFEEQFHKKITRIEI